MVKLPLYPLHPERVCWGCDRYCPAHDLACGNGSERTPHPLELFGEDWIQWATEQLGEPPVTMGLGGRMENVGGERITGTSFAAELPDV